jgi:hypothetical protein
MNVPAICNLSSTNTAEDDDNVDGMSQEDSRLDDDTFPDQALGSSSTRDALLLKCRDAIESLHGEIEEERTEKHRV